MEMMLLYLPLPWIPGEGRRDWSLSRHEDWALSTLDIPSPDLSLGHFPRCTKLPAKGFCELKEG